MSDNIFFLTTPIYYINSTPHLGHAYTTLAADARARFERLRGRRVYFLTGTDEHGAKVARAARELGRSPQEHADEVSAVFRACWDTLGISYDDYIRTTQPRHINVAQRVIEKLWAGGHLSLGSYSGWYSVPDETFFRPEDTVEINGAHYIANPTEDQSKAPLEWVEETTHFFNLSHSSAGLLEFYERHPQVLQPRTRRNEVLSFINSGLRDQSISRELEWGIALPAGIPSAAGHSIYVWFEALMNYLSAPGYLSDDEERRAFFEEVWPPDVQLMSKDIFTRFHATLWPALLRALDLPLPRQLFAHGFWTVGGRKMSKRDPETIVEPVSFAHQIKDLAGCDFGTAVDALRYYCLREVSFGVDGDFSREGCFARYNSDLANGLGNLVQRALAMLERYFERSVPAADADLGLRTAAAQALPRIENAYQSLDFSGALGAVWEIVGQGNRLIEEQKPWAKMKTGDTQSVAALLVELLGLCQWSAVVLAPVMPHVSQRLLDLLAIEKPLSWAQAVEWEQLAPGHHCQSPQPLFPRIQNTVQAIVQPNLSRKPNVETENIAPINPATEAPATEAPATEAPAATSSDAAPQTSATPTINYEDFAKVELRAAKVLEAERVPKADKLLRLQVDLGTEKRQILAGIAQQFEPEALIGKTVVVVANLAPRKLRGLESQGMLLAASPTSDGPPAGLVTIDADVPPGSIIR